MLPKFSLRPTSAQPAYKSWPVVSDVPFTGNEDLEPVEFLRGDETYLAGNAFLTRARELGQLAGEQHAEALLSNQAEIPTEWRRFYLVFPGTVRRDPSGYLVVPDLVWLGRRWDLGWDWLGYRWRRGGRVVRLGK